MVRGLVSRSARLVQFDLPEHLEPGAVHHRAQFTAQVRFPTLAFNLETYWDRYYTNYPFYQNRGQWTSPSGPPGGQVQIGSFYNRLSPHGRWVWVNGQYVWVPNTNANWRPYTDGRWVYTNRGWTWVSNEPFGWATYHYGRWGYSHRIGWFWIPGTRWAPAWVSWRRSGDYIAWAPLPPDPNDPFSYGVSQAPIPDYYWQPVQANQFLSLNLAINIIIDQSEKERVIAATEQVGSVTQQDNTVVNTAIDPAFVEQVTQETVTPVEVALTTDPEQSGATEGDTLTIYQPPPEEQVAAEPPAVSIEEVEAESETAGQAPADEPDTEALVPPAPPPGEAPPPSDAPPVVGEETTTTEPATTEPIEPESIVCPEGTTLQNGECVLAETPPPPPPAEDLAPPEGATVPETTGEPPPPPPADQPTDQPAATEQEPAQTEQAPATTEEVPAPPPAEEPPPPPAASEEPPPPPPPPRPQRRRHRLRRHPPPATEEPAPPPPRRLRRNPRRHLPASGRGTGGAASASRDTAAGMPGRLRAPAGRHLRTARTAVAFPSKGGRAICRPSSIDGQNGSVASAIG